MAPQWGGYRILKSDKVNIGWTDLKQLWQAFVIVYGDLADDDDVLLRVKPVGQWGMQLKHIALSAELSDLERNRQVAELCYRVFSMVRFGVGEGDGDAPWVNEDAKVWRDEVPCPAKLLKHRLPDNLRQGVSKGSKQQPYPGVILGKQHWERKGEKFSKPIKLSLHRFACWLAEGNPSPEVGYATHMCGRACCLRLGCLRWGNARSNERDVRELAEQLGGMGLSKR